MRARTRRPSKLGFTSRGGKLLLQFVSTPTSVGIHLAPFELGRRLLFLKGKGFNQVRPGFKAQQLCVCVRVCVRQCVRVRVCVYITHA